MLENALLVINSLESGLLDILTIISRLDKFARSLLLILPHLLHIPLNQLVPLLKVRQGALHKVR